MPRKHTKKKGSTDLLTHLLIARAPGLQHSQRDSRTSFGIPSPGSLARSASRWSGADRCCTVGRVARFESPWRTVTVGSSGSIRQYCKRSPCRLGDPWRTHGVGSWYGMPRELKSASRFLFWWAGLSAESSSTREGNKSTVCSGARKHGSDAHEGKSKTTVFAKTLKST